MKALSRIAMAGLGVALLVAIAAPASAVCPNPNGVLVTGYLHTNPTFFASCGDFYGAYAGGFGGRCDGTLPGDGTQPSVSPNVQIYWWAAGSGDPANNGCGDTTCGDDDGGVALNFLNRRGQCSPTASSPCDANFAPNGWYYYTATFTGSWGAGSFIDGCADAPKSQCTCLLAVDEIDNVGTIALHATGKDAGSNYPMPTTVVSAAIPGPQIITSTRLGTGGGNVELQANLADFLTGNALAYSNGGDGCTPCATISYVLYETQGPRPGSVAPTTRDIGAAGSSPTNSAWTPMVYGPSGADPGNPMAPTPLGTSVYVESLCDPTPGTDSKDVWVAAQVTVDSGFNSFVVGGDSVKVECGPALNDDDLNVDPQLRPRPRPRPGSDVDRKPTRRDTGSRR